jgi:hypothetical protein
MGWIMFNFLEEVWVILAAEINIFHFCTVIYHALVKEIPFSCAAFIGP